MLLFFMATLSLCRSTSFFDGLKMWNLYIVSKDLNSATFCQRDVFLRTDRKTGVQSHFLKVITKIGGLLQLGAYAEAIMCFPERKGLHCSRASVISKGVPQISSIVQQFFSFQHHSCDGKPQC